MQGTLIKYKDTGSNDPFNARMMFGVMKLRDLIVKNDLERNEFDDLYNPILENLDDCQESKNQLVSLILHHREQIETGTIVGFQNNGEIVEVKESIDRQVNQYFKDFFIKGEIALKALQYLVKRYGLDIGFFFQKINKFDQGIKQLMESGSLRDKEFAKMLIEDRKWHDFFNEVRSKIEHGGLSLGHAKYQNNNGKVTLLLPRINNQEIDKIVELMWTNVFEFSEDVDRYPLN